MERLIRARQFSQCGKLWGGGEELLGVGFAGGVADFAPGAGFDDAAVLHDGDAVAEIAHERHGVRDEETGEAVALLEVAQQVDDLRADGDIERADGFVEDEEFGAQGDGSGNVDALALASGELVGIATECGGFEADFGEEFVETGFETLLRLFVVDGEGLGEDMADGHARVERGVGVLKDDGELAAEAAHLVWIYAKKIVCVRAGFACGLRRVVEEDAAAGGFD